MDPAITSCGWCLWSLILERAHKSAQVMQAHCSHGFKYCEGLFLGTPGMRRCRKHCEKLFPSLSIIINFYYTYDQKYGGENRDRGVARRKGFDRVPHPVVTEFCVGASKVFNISAQQLLISQKPI